VRKGSVVLGRRLTLKDEFLHTVPCNSFADGRFADPVGDGKSLKPTLIDDRRRGHDGPDAAALGRSIRSAKLRCTIDPNEIMQKAGGGAQCNFETGQ
jgi:hypothetical protein